MATFLLPLCIWNSYSSTHWPGFPWRLHVLRCEETQASRGSRGCLVSSESQQKRACGENHMSMWQDTTITFLWQNQQVDYKCASFDPCMHGRSLENARDAWDMIVLCLYYSRRAKACFPIQDSSERISAVVIFRMSWKGPQYMSYYPNREWFILIMPHYFGEILTCDFCCSLVVFRARMW